MVGHLSTGRLLVLAIVYLVCVASACGSGYWIGRSRPVRFNGEKVLIGLILGLMGALVIYGSDKLMDIPVQPFRIFMFLGWFVLQGISGEVTVQVVARRKAGNDKAF